MDSYILIGEKKKGDIRMKKVSICLLIVSVLIALVGCAGGSQHDMVKDIPEVKELHDALLKDPDIKDVTFSYSPRITDIKVSPKDNLKDDKIEQVFYQIKNVVTSDSTLAEMKKLYTPNDDEVTSRFEINFGAISYTGNYILIPPGKTENEIVKYKYWNKAINYNVVESYISGTGVKSDK